MKLFVLSPFADTMFDPPLRQALDAAGDVIAITRLDDWSTLAESFAEPGDKVIAIDPRFCNWTVPNIVLDKARDTRAICLQTTSFSWVDVAHARARSVVVTNNRDFSTIAVAEWATMMVLLLARRIPLITGAGTHPQFTPDYRGIELRGRIAGIVGLGRIGTALAENMAGLGMDVQYWSRSSVDARFRKVALDELMRSSDVVLPAVAKNDQTNRLLDDALVRSMKRSPLCQ
jgi:phosphoglycerate dehydrogenase-like enzyme